MDGHSQFLTVIHNRACEPTELTGFFDPDGYGMPPIIQEFLPSSPSMKVRTSFKTSDTIGLLSKFEGRRR